MDKIKQTLFTGWDFMRWLRLAFEVLFAAEAVRMLDAFMGFAAVFFLFTAVLNTGCCGSAGCAVPAKKSRGDETE